MQTPHVLIIGGGFAGVAAAASLHAGGVEVTLLDDRHTLGGRARSDAFAGLMVDTGAQFIASSFSRTVRLLVRAGTTRGALDDAMTAGDAPIGLHVAPGHDALLRDGARHPLQYGSVRSLLSFSALGAVEKMKLGAYLLPLLARHRAELDAGAGPVPASLDREAARAYVASRIDERAADLFVEPPLNSFYTTRGREASLAFFLMLGRYGTESELLAPGAGWSDVIVDVLRGVTHVPNARVSTLALPDGGGVLARTEDGREWGGDRAIIATGPRTARALLAPHVAATDRLLRWLDSVELRQSWTLALALNVPLRRDVFGIFHDVRSAQAVSACAVYGAKLGGAAPTDRDVLLAWPTPDAAARLARESSETIAAAMMPEIEQLVPDARGHVTRARLYRFDEGTPVAHTGFAADRERGRTLAEQLALPVALAGDYLTAPLIEGAVASGERAASRLLATLAGDGV